ncbi:MAG: hypothetical protein ACREE0_21860 [Phenylobacterium sp.]
MIRYAKSAAVPSSLARGLPETADNCAAYDANPAAYRAGTVKFEIRSGIYGTNVVKRRLKQDQHDKCGFCEAIFDANVAGDVEHYRPKGAVETETGKIHPGYYWLGYAWPNLSYACPDCNEYRKRDHFPLADEAARARDYHGDVTAEAPLLLDPYGDRDPRDHILFRGEAPIARNWSPEGAATIELLALDRVTLARERLHHLRQLSLLHEGMRLLEHDPRPAAVAYVAQVRAQLAAAVTPQARFSAASADHLAALDAGRSYLPAETPPGP